MRGFGTLRGGDDAAQEMLSAAAVADAVFDEVSRAAAAQGLDVNEQMSAESVRRRHESYALLTEDHLSKLHFLFGKNLERAMEILDFGGVRRVVARPSGRKFFQVQGKSKGTDRYLCFPTHFCACQSFFYEVVGRGEQLACKHQIAARLGDSLCCLPQITMSDAAAAKILSLN